MSTEKGSYPQDFSHLNLKWAIEWVNHLVEHGSTKTVSDMLQSEVQNSKHFSHNEVARNTASLTENALFVLNSLEDPSLTIVQMGSKYDLPELRVWLETLVSDLTHNVIEIEEKRIRLAESHIDNFGWKPYFIELTHQQITVRYDVESPNEECIGCFAIVYQNNGDSISSYPRGIQGEIAPSKRFIDTIINHSVTYGLPVHTWEVLESIDDILQDNVYKAEYRLDRYILPALTHIIDNPTDVAETEYIIGRFQQLWAAILDQNFDRSVKEWEAYRKVVIEKWLSRKKVAGYVYLIKGLYENPTYKIGFTKVKKTRIRKLDVVLPFPIEVMHLIETDHMKAVEAYLHDKYDNKRGNGEWFELTEQDVADICAIETLNAEDIA